MKARIFRARPRYPSFIKTGNPNCDGRPACPKFKSGQRQVIDVSTRAEGAEKARAPYETIERVGKK